MINLALLFPAELSLVLPLDWLPGENRLNFSSRHTVGSPGIPSCFEQRISSFPNTINVADCSVSPCAVGQHCWTSQNVRCGKGGGCRVLADGSSDVLKYVNGGGVLQSHFDLYLLSHILYPLKKPQYINLALKKYCTIRLIIVVYRSRTHKCTNELTDNPE